MGAHGASDGGGGEGVTETTLCYIRRGGEWLMLHRAGRENDENAGKWIGVGGHIEPGETPEECLLREVREETGLTLTRWHARGVIDFSSDVWGEERMYLFTADEFTGEVTACDEGELRWVPEAEVPLLPTWAGDRIFLNLLLEGEPFFHLSLKYEGETLVGYRLEA